MGLEFSVRHNLDAIFAQRYAGLNNNSLSKALEKLSSGYRINRASDDAAGLAVSEKLRTQSRGFRMASRNIQDAVSMIQAADGGLSELYDVMQRMRELAVQASNGVYTTSDRILIQQEVDQLLNEINRMQTSIEFNRFKLLDGTFSSRPGNPAGNAAPQDYGPQVGTQLRTGSTWQGSLVFHVGASESQVLRISIGTLSVQALGLASLFSSTGAVTGIFKEEFRVMVSGVTTADINHGKILNGVLSQLKAESAIGILDSAINLLSTQRTRLGASQNRLDHALNYVGIAAENLEAAESRIRDTDMAEEIINFTKAQVLVQASQAMLAQANLKTTSLLQFLG